MSSPKADRKAGVLRLYLDGRRVVEQAATLNGSHVTSASCSWRETAGRMRR